MRHVLGSVVLLQPPLAIVAEFEFELPTQAKTGLEWATRQISRKWSPRDRFFRGNSCSGVIWRELQLSCEEGRLLMLRIVGVCIAILVGVIMTLNAAFMLASPRSWFRLPTWLKAQGSLIEGKYASGWGAIQIRLTGALILAAIAWVLYDMFLPR